MQALEYRSTNSSRADSLKIAELRQKTTERKQQLHSEFRSYKLVQSEEQTCAELISHLQRVHTEAMANNECTIQQQLAMVRRLETDAEATQRAQSALTLQAASLTPMLPDDGDGTDDED